MDKRFDLDDGIIKFFYKPDKNYSDELENVDDKQQNEFERLSTSELLNQASEAAEKNDFQKAKQLWEIAAKYGNDHAEYCLALCYLEGWDSEVNYNLAFKYFKKSAEKGNFRAEYYLAYCYEFVFGTEINSDLEFESCQKSAEKDFV